MRNTEFDSKLLARLAGAVLLAGATSFAVVGCEEHNDVGDAAEEAGDNIEDAADDAGDAIDDAVDDTKDAIDDAVDG